MSDSKHHGVLELRIEEAHNAVDALGSRVRNASQYPSPKETSVEHLDNTVNRVNTFAHSDSASDIAQIVQYGVDNVKDRYALLLEVLDTVSAVHPFVSVAALAFKTVIHLEMTRRENDDRVLALHAEMCNLMSIVAMLRHFPREHEVNEQTIGRRLSSQMEEIAENIKRCAATCDAFQNKPLIIKAFTSLRWEARFREFANTFEAQKEALHKELVMLSSFGLRKANEILASVHDRLIGMEQKFDLLRSPQELRLLNFIHNHGGVQNVWEDERLRYELDVLSEELGLDREDRLISRVTDVWEQVGHGLHLTFETLLRENQAIFDRKFRLQYTRLQELAANLQQGGDEILDLDFRKFWKDMGWREKRRVRAKKMVTALLNFASERSVTPNTPIAVGTIDWSTNSSNVERPDAWAANYLSPTRMRGLLEALDIDGSSMITISEVNSFSALRPRNWSFARWLAYWTIGAQLAIRSYYDRIQGLIETMCVVSADTLPSNRMFVQKLLGEGVFYASDILLSGIHSTASTMELDNTPFSMFEAHERLEEALLKEALQTINYELDAPNTLSLVIGSKRPEKCILPVLYLLLEQCLELVKASTAVAIQRQQVFLLRQSLWTLLRTSYRRSEAIKELSRIANAGSDHEYLIDFSFGLYRYVYQFEDLGTSEYVLHRHHHRTLFTPGVNKEATIGSSATGAKLVLPLPAASLRIPESLWRYDNVKEVVTDFRHPMHSFVRLCVEQGVLAPEDDTGNMFILMATEATAKAERRDELAFEEILRVDSNKPRRQDSLRPVHAMSLSEIRKLANRYADAPEELRFFCTVIDSIVRRQVIHSPVMCDKCKKRTINMTRLLCLGCQEDDGSLKSGKTTDYCAKCLFEDLQLDCAAALLQASYHPFLQIRQSTFNKWTHGLMYHAREVSQKISMMYAPLGIEQSMDTTRPPCRLCGDPVEFPFWCCLDCDETDGCYVCQQCNLEQEKEIQVLVLEDSWVRNSLGPLHRNGAAATHHWSHSLVLVLSGAPRQLPVPSSRRKKQVLIMSPDIDSDSSAVLDSPRPLAVEPISNDAFHLTYSPFAIHNSPWAGVTTTPLQPNQIILSPWQVPLPISPPNPQNGFPSTLPLRQVSLPALPPGFTPTSFTPRPQPGVSHHNNWTPTQMLQTFPFPLSSLPTLEHQRQERTWSDRHSTWAARSPADAVADMLQYPQKSHSPPIPSAPRLPSRDIVSDQLRDVPRSGIPEGVRSTSFAPLPASVVAPSFTSPKTGNEQSLSHSLNDLPAGMRPPTFAPAYMPGAAHQTGITLGAGIMPVVPSHPMLQTGVPMLSWEGQHAQVPIDRIQVPQVPPVSGVQKMPPDWEKGTRLHTIPPFPPTPAAQPTSSPSASHVPVITPDRPFQVDAMSVSTLNEFWRLNERLMTMEKSIVRRVARVSSQFVEHSGDLQEACAHLQLHLNRLAETHKLTSNETEHSNTGHAPGNLLREIEARIQDLEVRLAGLHPKPQNELNPEKASVLSSNVVSRRQTVLTAERAVNSSGPLLAQAEQTEFQTIPIAKSEVEPTQAVPSLSMMEKDSSVKVENRHTAESKRTTVTKLWRRVIARSGK